MPVKSSLLNSKAETAGPSNAPCDSEKTEIFGVQDTPSVAEPT